MSGEPKTDEPASAASQTASASEATGTGDDRIKVEANGSDDASVENDPVKVLETKVAALEKDKKDNWDRYLRSAADLENLRKRQKREIEDAKLDAKNKILKEMLPVVDNLERAIEHAAASGSNPIVEGVQLVLRQFTTAFERLDVTAIDAEGQPFDPNLHEAISQQESEQAPGTVVQVLQRGYRSGERLLRPALVVVAKAPAKAAE